MDEGRRDRLSRSSVRSPRGATGDQQRRLLENGAKLVQEGDSIPAIAPFVFDDFGNGAAAEDMIARCTADMATHHARVINATGVLLHTNLGRAPWAADAIDGVEEPVCGEVQQAAAK